MYVRGGRGLRGGTRGSRETWRGYARGVGGQGKSWGDSKALRRTGERELEVRGDTGWSWGDGQALGMREGGRRGPGCLAGGQQACLRGSDCGRSFAMVKISEESAMALSTCDTVQVTVSPATPDYISSGLAATTKNFGWRQNLALWMDIKTSTNKLDSEPGYTS